MGSFEIAFDNEFDEFVTVEAFDITGAVEEAADNYCDKQCEWDISECHARVAGDKQWKKFSVSIESRPVFYASEVK